MTGLNGAFSVNVGTLNVAPDTKFALTKLSPLNEIASLQISLQSSEKGKKLALLV